jgi:hypothetical protein
VRPGGHRLCGISFSTDWWFTSEPTFPRYLLRGSTPQEGENVVLLFFRTYMHNSLK